MEMFVLSYVNVNPLQYSCLENPMDGGAWWATVHGVAKSWTQLSDFTFTFHFRALEKEMATHSSVLAWRIPGTGAWWAAVYGVTQSWTRLMWLSCSSSSNTYMCVWIEIYLSVQKRNVHTVMLWILQLYFIPFLTLWVWFVYFLG